MHLHRNDIEGLRAIAVVAVVLGHAGVPHLDGGFVGVDVFFVISGFLITGLLLDEGDDPDGRGRPSLLRFYARRARRILPLAAFVLLSVVAASYVVAGSAYGNDTAVDATWSAGFLANVHFAHEGVDYFNRGGFDSPVEHFWSLGVEEQFYVVWPLVVIAVSLLARAARPRRRLLAVGLLVVCAASLVWSIHQTGTSPTDAYFSPLTRAFELGTGALLATLVRGRKVVLTHAVAGLAGVVGLVAVVASALVLDAGTAFPGYAALLPTLGTALVILAGTDAPGGPVSRLLGTAPLRFVGGRSYGFYLWHLPFLVLATVELGHDPTPAVRAGLVGAAFLVACVTYEVVEQPVRTSAWLRSRPQVLSLGLGAVLVAAVVGGAQLGQSLHAVHYTPPPQVSVPQLDDATTVEEQVATAAALTAAPADVDPPLEGISQYGSPDSTETVCDRTYDAATADTCFLDDEGTDTVVVWGDSHAGMWVPGLMAVTAQSGQRLAGLVKYGCPPLLATPAWHPTEDRPYDECDSYVRSAVKVILSLHPSTIVLSGAFRDWAPVDGGKPRPVDQPGNDTYWEAGLQRTLEALRPSGARIVVLGDISYQEQDEAVCLPTHADDLAACTTPTGPAIDVAHLESEERTTQTAGATYVSTIPWLCTTTVCPTVIAGHVVYRDAAHLTRQYSRHLALALGSATGLL